MRLAPKAVSQWTLDNELFFACLSRHGLSAPEIALAEAIAQPGLAYEELAIMVKARIRRVNNAMTRRGLYAISAVRKRNREKK